MRINVFLAMLDDGTIISAHKTFSGAVAEVTREILDRDGYTPDEIARMRRQLEEDGWIYGVGGVENVGELCE